MTAEAGLISLPAKALEDMLANSSNFRTWVGAADVAAARAFIHHHTYSGSTFPNVVIGEEQASQARKIALDTYMGTGMLSMTFQKAIPAPDKNTYDDIADLRETLVVFGNSLGPIIEDLAALADTGGYLSLGGPIEPDGGRSIEDHDAEGSAPLRIMWIKYRFPWGY